MCDGLLYKLSYLYFLLDNIAVQIFPPKIRKIKKKCFVVKNVYLITSLLWHQKVFKERWGHYAIIIILILYYYIYLHDYFWHLYCHTTLISTFSGKRVIWHSDRHHVWSDTISDVLPVFSALPELFRGVVYYDRSKCERPCTGVEN